MQSETELCQEQDEWQQGDIIGLDNPQCDDSPGLGVLINADCDLAHGKTDGFFAYLPLYSFHDYLVRFWMPGQIENARLDSTKRIVEVVNAGKTGATDLHNLMLARSACDNVAEQLKSLENVKQKDHGIIDEHVQKLEICYREASISERFSAFCRLQKDPTKYTRAQIERAKGTLGDGHFFISEVVGQEVIGYVVRMRRIFTIGEWCAFKSFAAQRANSTGQQLTAFRIGRLTPLFRVRVLQLFGQQFLRVGLPDDITALSSLAIEDIVHRFTGPSL